MRRLAPICLLAACASPSMQGATPREAVVEDSRFRIWVEPGGTRVEAHRVSFEFLPSRVEVYRRAYVAIGQVTGCAIVEGSLGGDQAIVVAEIDCAAPAPAAAQRKSSR